MIAEYPRFTRALRAFTDLDLPKTVKPSTLEERRKWGSQNSYENKKYSWGDIRAHVESSNGSKSQVFKNLNQLRTFAEELSGGDSGKELIDEASVYLLQMFIEEKLVSNKHLTIMKQMFGTVSHNMANKVYECVSSIRDHLSEEDISQILNLSSKRNVESRKRYRSAFPHIAPKRQAYQPDVSKLDNLLQELGSDATIDFSMDYDSIATFQNKEDQASKKHSKKYGASWLEKEIQKNLERTNGGLSAKELCSTIITLLKTGHSNDELQNELFDLLGFDSFELIETLLQHRADIIQVVSVMEEHKSSQSGTVLEQRRPMYGCQVIVQSVQEKQLMKQVRKEEKKWSKIASRIEEEDGEVEFDPVELREKRKAALEARNAPIFRDRLRAPQAQEKYPNVYDSQRLAQQTSAFICGVKMVLPADVERVDNRKYEEVNIPVSKTNSLKINTKFVEIASLDEEKISEGKRKDSTIEASASDWEKLKTYKNQMNVFELGYNYYQPQIQTLLMGKKTGETFLPITIKQNQNWLC